MRYAPASETRLTFDREKARAYFDSINRKDLSLPDKLHGATLVVALPPVVMLEYAGSNNKPAVMIGQAREVEVRRGRERQPGRGPQLPAQHAERAA